MDVVELFSDLYLSKSRFSRKAQVRAGRVSGGLETAVTRYDC